MLKHKTDKKYLADIISEIRACAERFVHRNVVQRNHCEDKIEDCL